MDPSTTEILSRLHKRILFLEGIAEYEVNKMRSQGKFICELCLSGGPTPNCGCKALAAEYRVSQLAKAHAAEARQSAGISIIVASAVIILPFTLWLAHRAAVK